MNVTAKLAAGALLLATPMWVATAAAPKKAAPHQPPPAAENALIDPEALRAVEASRAYLRTIKTAEIRAEMTIDDVEEDDVTLEMLNRARYVFQSPDKLFIEWSSDRAIRRLYFDGTTATLFSPRLGYYAQKQEPGTVASMLIKAAENYGIVFPLPDIFVWAVKGGEPMNIRQAIVVGYARIAGVDTDQYFFRQPDLDWQIWIERGDHPLPRKIVITTRGDPAKPRVSALLQWSVDPVIPDGTFTFVPPPGTTPVNLLALRNEEPKK
jgi:hypothetical protein